jgi:hypothetical protein
MQRLSLNSQLTNTHQVKRRNEAANQIASVVD